MKTLAEIQDDATELRALANHFSHQRDVNFVVECADSLQALAQARDTTQAEAKALRGENKVLKEELKEAQQKAAKAPWFAREDEDDFS